MFVTARAHPFRMIRLKASCQREQEHTFLNDWEHQVSIMEVSLEVDESQTPDSEEILDLGEEWTVFESKCAKKASRV